MTRPADLHLGDRIPTDLCGNLVVRTEPFVDECDTDPRWNRVYVDVVPDDQGSRWDADRLTEATGAEGFQFLGLHPLRYRLTFLPNAEVAVAPLGMVPDGAQ